MTNRKLKKERREIPVRQRGEVIQPIERPSKSLFDAVLKAEQESSPSQAGLTGSPSLPSSTGLTTPTGLTEIQRQPVSPEKDFTKTPNSVVRLIVAQGLFKGKSKQIYDYAWSVSRGAIKPQRTFRKTQAEIKKGSGIGSLNTIKDGIKHLEAIGLFKKIDSKIGEREGSEFEIFTPEELGYTSSTGLTSLSGSTGLTELAQNLVRPVEPDFGLTGLTQPPIGIEANEALRHSFKTNKNDDEAFANFIVDFQNLSQKLHGKNLKDLPQTAKVLVTELERLDAIKPITDIDAFLAEHLRRALARTEIKKGSDKIKDTVGETKLEFNLKRELATLRDLVELDGLESVLASIDTYDFTEKQKEALRQGLKGS